MSSCVSGPENIPVHLLPSVSLMGTLIFASQLQAKFEHLKRVHQEERMKLEEKRRLLEEEIISFSKKKASSEIYQNQTFMATGCNLKKDRDRKK